MSIYDLAYFDIRISVGLWSVCCRFVIGLSSGLSVCCRLQVQHCANDRFSIGVMSVIYRSQIGRFHTESYQTWTRLVLRCLQQHCRWPTAGRFIENFVPFVGFVSVWPVWLGYNTPVTPAKPTRNRPQTDKNHQIRGEIGLQSVLIRFCRFDVGLCSGRQICRGEIFQTCLKDLSPTNCRLSVGYMSVWCRFCRGAFGDVSVLIWPPMVDGLSVFNRLCIGHMSADLTPIQSRFKTESSPT